MGQHGCAVAVGRFDGHQVAHQTGRVGIGPVYGDRRRGDGGMSQQRVADGKIKKAAVLGAVLQLGHCCDFLDSKFPLFNG